MLIGYEGAFTATQSGPESNQETIRRREAPSDAFWFAHRWHVVYLGWAQAPRPADVIPADSEVRRCEYPQDISPFRHRFSHDHLGFTQSAFPRPLSDVCDTFNRADGGLGSNWTTVTGLGGAPQIVSQQVEPAAIDDHYVAFYSAQAFAADQFSEVTIVNATSTSFGGSPVVRASNTGGANFYTMSVANNNVRIWKWVLGVATQLINFGTITVNAGYRARIEVEGTAIRAYIQGVLIGSTTDADLSSGSPGLQTRSTTSTDTGAVDDW